ncbi:MAG: GGDEF domain-containing protein [Anaeromyxobacter sp.]
MAETDPPTRSRQTGEAPAVGSPFSVVMVRGPAAGVRVPLEGEVVVGRDPRCELPVPSGDVSRRHARIVPEGDGHRIIDLESTNGTFVNGRSVRDHRLAAGDRIELGSCVLRYLRQGEADAEDIAALAELVRRDALTGLANRRAFEEALRREVARARRAGDLLSVVAIDVDHFKNVNDEHGHAAGDQVLVEVAFRAASALRTEDLLARIGGEELAVLLPGATLPAAAEVAERIRRAVADRTVSVPDGEVAVTVSLGCATLAPGESDPSSLVARADARLYDAKRAGRNRVVFATVPAAAQ